MRIITKAEFETQRADFEEQIRQGAVFIYPTDTIYGIGCNAESEDAVNKIREIKERPTNPFSVMAPSKEWIENNFDESEKRDEWIAKLPGPYTLLLTPSTPAVATSVAQDKPTVGVRIPNHWCSDIASRLKLPIVSTSANKQGEQFMTSLETLDDDVKSKVDFIIYEGEINGKPSTIVDVAQGTLKERS